MIASGEFRLGMRMAAAYARIAADRVREYTGTALPRTVDQLARPEVVNALLRDHRPPTGTPLPPVRRVRLPGVQFESSNCTNFLIDVDFDTADDIAALPRSLYVKMPCAEIATRAFANAVGFWEVEAAFCSTIASAVQIRVPRAYAVARRGARFVLLLENLLDVPGAQLFCNLDMAIGTTPERARICLSTFAELHAPFWGWTDDRRRALLPNSLHIYLAPGGRDLTRALNAAAIAPAHRAAPEIFTERHVDICRRAIAKWNSLVDCWYADPLTLIHGDSHYANCFEYPTPDGPRMGMLDFQGMQWCKGIRDVQYFLTYSLDADALAEHEDELIDFYLDRLAALGVIIDRGEARAQYRSFALQTLMVAVVSLGLGGLTERDETVRTVLRRSVAAIDRLGVDDWLHRLR
jgi:hypothetical protein